MKYRFGSATTKPHYNRFNSILQTATLDRDGNSYIIYKYKKKHQLIWFMFNVQDKYFIHIQELGRD